MCDTSTNFVFLNICIADTKDIDPKREEVMAILKTNF